MNEAEQKEHDAKVAAAREANSVMNTERLKKIEAIADTVDHEEDESERTERLAAEEAEATAKALQTEGVTPEPEEEATPETESDTRVTNGETYYRQVVNGTEKWQTLADIRRTAAKVESGDEYLRQASEAVKNASRLALSPKDETSNIERVDVRKVLRAAVLGDEEALEQLASVLETRPSEVTPDVLRTIDQRLSFRTELAKLEDKSRDLLENPYMGRLFRSRLGEMKEQNPTMSLDEAYTSIDKELRTAFPGVTKTKTTDKLERKRTLVNVPTAASRQVEEAEDEGEEDVGVTIQKIAKGRHTEAIIHGPRRQS